MTGTVTIPLDEYMVLRDKAATITAMENNPKAFAVFYVSNHSYFGTTNKYVGKGDDIFKGLVEANESLKKTIESLECENRNYKNTVFVAREDKQKPWYQFW